MIGGFTYSPGYKYANGAAATKSRVRLTALVAGGAGVALVKSASW